MAGGYSPNESGFANWMNANGYRAPQRREEYDERKKQYNAYLKEQETAKTPTTDMSANESMGGVAPLQSAEDVSRQQVAAQQADPESDQASSERGESVSRKRRSRSTGKKVLSVRRASGSGINI